MQLRNFQIGSDGISLSWQGQYLDLHNCFDFQSFHYAIQSRQIELCWRRSLEEWAKGTALPGLKLVFSDIFFFRVKERDVDYPFTEDDFLMSVSFHPIELRDEFDSISLSSSPADDLTFFFQSEWGFKINAAIVALQPQLV
ncbi:hypothetical protein [Hymenobacter sp. BT559]|uniref:hypothetical protein n=1 Tax=Hymenobacter sp. BT559 TaxID=2795729 RepID=UPI0018EA7759|nr:hypothetical protein [Hymenobacter sp. BT559]MBJ6141919.1 hypothetical protein [Hymenobacter sp. BT559]